ncbi:MAG: dTMP kinase [Candidatus Babeliales bacterium]
MRTLTTGVLITLEGIDGSGKSTLAANLAAAFVKEQLPVILTQEPGKTGLGKLVKPIVQEKKVPLHPLAEFFLFAADRAQHFDEIVIPALAAHQIVISDRMADSSLVYQGYGKGLDLDRIHQVNTWAMRSIQPTLVIYVKVDPAVARARLIARKQGLSSFEHYISYQEKIAAGFDTLLAHRPHVLTVNGELDQETLTLTTFTSIVERLSSQGLLQCI